MIPAVAAVWPPPQELVRAGITTQLCRHFQIVALPADTTILRDGIARSMKTLARLQLLDSFISPSCLQSMHFEISSSDESLHEQTHYDYTLMVRDATVRVTATSVYGALYGMLSYLACT